MINFFHSTIFLVHYL